MNPVVQTFAGLLLLLVLLLVMSGIARVSEWFENDGKEELDDVTNRKNIREQTDKKESSDSGKTRHSS